MRRLAAFFWLLLVLPAYAGPRLVFAGDVMLGRGVAAEIIRTGKPPFAGLQGLGRPDLMMGNFEGAAGNLADCTPDPRPVAEQPPCLAMPVAMVQSLVGSNFTAFSLANNHAADLGEVGRAASAETLRQLGITPVPPSETPVFVRVGPHIVALVALSMVPGRDGSADRIPSVAVAQQLRLAHALGDLTVVFIHWGAEFRDWPQPDQQAAAAWLTQHGADLIVGAHPHVAITPSCVNGVPVFWSLGNLLFDQNFAMTRLGMLADCDISAGVLGCRARGTRAVPGSTYPILTGSLPAPIETCRRVLRAGLSVAGWQVHGLTQADGSLDLLGSKPGQQGWQVKGPVALLAADAAQFGPGQPERLFLLERVYSRIDGAVAPRPYIYDLRDYGLKALWRGAALGWPLVDARMMAGNPDFLCSLHRDDSFLELNPAAPADRVEAWQWNGFGFTLDAAQQGQCSGLW